MNTVAQITEKEVAGLEFPPLDIRWEHDHDDFTGEPYSYYRNDEETIEIGEMAIVFKIYIGSDGDATIDVKEFWADYETKFELDAKTESALSRTMEKFYSNPLNII